MATQTLMISTSPRAVWLWADDPVTRDAARAALDRDGSWWGPARRGRELLPLVTEIEIGDVALEACERLAEGGFEFAWHDEVALDERDSWPSALPGMSEDDPS